ncbi:tensin-1-like [Ursus arctos]|uniref:tensin-1-like n=1 Tax=Ursus arctos TaxID=9644 RepID=UPI00254684E7|nr:tensin-1-like [Ursus arctos]
MGCTVSLVCCEALEPGPPCGPQPPGSPPAPARPERWEPGASVRAESGRLPLQDEAPSQPQPVPTAPLAFALVGAAVSGCSLPLPSILQLSGDP